MSDRIRLGTFTLDLAREALLDARGDVVPLRPQSFAVLRHLVRNRGRLVPKDELMGAIWPSTAVTDDSLVQCVGDIRRVLGDAGQAMVRTIPKRGYRFEIATEPVDGDPAGDGSPPASASEEATVPAVPDPRAAASRPRFRALSRRPVSVAVLCLAVVAAVVVGLIQRPLPGNASGPATLAVLPLANISGEPALDYFASGTTENLVAHLARSPELSVLTAPAASAASPDPAGIGRDLGARYVLTGSVQKHDDRMRIVAQLVDARSGDHVWAERFDRESADPFSLQDEVTEETIRAISGEFGLIKKRQYEEAWGKDAGSLGEYDYYLRGHGLFMRFTPADNEEALRIWSEGMARYPASALLPVKAGYTHFMKLQLGWTADRDADLATGFALARQGLSAVRQTPLSRTLGHMLMAELSFYDRDFDRAMKERATVLELAPHDFFHKANLAYIAVGAGRPDEAVEALRDITPHHPLADFGYAALAWAHFAKRDYEASIRAAGAALSPLPVYAFAFEAASYAELGETDRARASLAKLLDGEPNASLAMMREVHPNADAEVLEREIAALRRTGLRETAP